jgi:hypothetical protein
MPVFDKYQITQYKLQSPSLFFEKSFVDISVFVITEILFFFAMEGIKISSLKTNRIK